MTNKGHSDGKGIVLLLLVMALLVLCGWALLGWVFHFFGGSWPVSLLGSAVVMALVIKMIKRRK